VSTRAASPPAVLSPRCKGFKKIDRSVIKRMFKQGKSDAQIAEKLNTSSGTICGIRTKELGLYKVHKPLTKGQKAEILLLVEQGYKDSVIGGMLGLGKNTVSRIRRGAGILRHHKNLMIDHAEVKRLWEEGKDDGEIAETMGFSIGSIRNVRVNDLNIHKSKVKIHRDVVTRLFHEGYTDHEISEHLGCAVTSLRAVRRELRSKTR